MEGRARRHLATSAPSDKDKVSLPACAAEHLKAIGYNKSAPPPPPSDVAYEQLQANATSDNHFGEAFRRNSWLRLLLAGQGLVSGMPPTWPTNCSFEQILELAGGIIPVNGSGGFVVNVGAGDGRRLDNYHKPVDPMWPLFALGYGGLAIESNRRFDHSASANETKELPTGMSFAAGKLSLALSEVNQSGAIRIAWDSARPDNIASLLRSHATPTDLDALAIDTDSHEVALLAAILEAGFAPKAIAINVNPDWPPPIQVSWRQLRPRGAASTAADIEAAAAASARLDGAASAMGLGAGSADALYSLLSPRWSLLAFDFGRFARWCQRCNQRAWWVRSDLLGRSAATEGPLTTWEDMTRMFWSSMVASQV